MALGALGLVKAALMPSYAALTTLPDLRHRVHTRMRLMPPLIMARTV